MAQSPSGQDTRAASKTGNRLGKEVADFLIEFSIAVHRYSMYPSGHPTLASAGSKVLTRLSRLLEEKAELSLGVAHRQLVIDGVATDRDHPVLSDLADRLKDNHVGAITFTLDAVTQSLEGLFRALAAGSEGEEEPIGLRPPDEIPSWLGIKVYPVGYRDLTLDEDGDPTTDGQVLQLWLGLARAAMAGAAEEVDWDDEDEEPPPEVVARHLRGKKGRAYDEVIVGYLLQIAEQLAVGDDSLKPLKDRVTDLVSRLDKPTLERILRIGGDAQRRRTIVRRAFQGLGGTAALKILETAASTSGQEISVLMVRMLTKLSFHADVGSASLRPKAAHVVRESVDELLDGWNQEDPNPAGYVRILDELSKASPYLQPAGSRLESRTSARSLVQMAIEVDSYGAMIDDAIDEMLAKGGLTYIAPLVEAEPDNDAARRIRERVGSPKQIDALAEFEQVSSQSLELLVELVGQERAMTPLLRLLAESQARALRRAVFDQLVQMADQIGRKITPFLEDPRWYVVRNMLELVAALPEPPAGFNALRYASHPDARVRRSALPLALGHPDSRARALVLALREPDERMVRMGLLNLREEFSHVVVPFVIDRCLRNEDMSPSLRLLAIRVLEPSHDPSARDALIGIATVGKTILGKPKLAATEGSEGELTKAALEILASQWANDPAVSSLFKAVEKSGDATLRSIVEHAGSGQDDEDDETVAVQVDAMRRMWKGDA